MRRVLATVILGLWACGGSKAPEPGGKDLGTATGETASDIAALREASAAVSVVIRSGTDCEAAKPAITAAYEKLDQVEDALKTPTGKVTLDSLRKQVDNVAQICP